MKRPHLLHATAEPVEFASLVAVAEEAGYRVGWLEVDAAVEAPSPLSDACRMGAFRSVAATASGSVSVKRRRGAWVLDDLLREHFLGCRLVLVRGAPAVEVGLEEIAPAGRERWRLGAAHELDREGLKRWLRRPPGAVSAPAPA